MAWTGPQTTLYQDDRTNVLLDWTHNRRSPPYGEESCSHKEDEWTRLKLPTLSLPGLNFWIYTESSACVWGRALKSNAIEPFASPWRWMMNRNVSLEQHQTQVRRERKNGSLQFCPIKCVLACDANFAFWDHPSIHLSGEELLLLSFSFTLSLSLSLSLSLLSTHTWLDVCWKRGNWGEARTIIIVRREDRHR